MQPAATCLDCGAIVPWPKYVRGPVGRTYCQTCNARRLSHTRAASDVGLDKPAPASKRSRRPKPTT